jgi:hypothetical protein
MRVRNKAHVMEQGISIADATGLPCVAVYSVIN